MLVCNVSLRPPRAGIAADIVETIEATDATVDAYLGEIMLEAASASSTVNAGLTYAAAVVEAVTAADTSSASVPVAATVAEIATAADTPDATVTGAVPSRSAMVPWTFINPGTSREAHVDGTMVNL